METITIERVQTAFRLNRNLVERLKRNAEKERRSLNSYVEGLLEKATKPEFPHLPPDFVVSDEILSLRSNIIVPPEYIAKDAAEQAEIDKRLKLEYLMEKYVG